MIIFCLMLNHYYDYTLIRAGQTSFFALMRVQKDLYYYYYYYCYCADEDDDYEMIFHGATFSDAQNTDNMISKMLNVSIERMMS